MFPRHQTVSRDATFQAHHRLAHVRQAISYNLGKDISSQIPQDGPPVLAQG
jgi:hypothetical protein